MLVEAFIEVLVVSMPDIAGHLRVHFRACKHPSRPLLARTARIVLLELAPLSSDRCPPTGAEAIEGIRLQQAFCSREYIA